MRETRVLIHFEGHKFEFHELWRNFKLRDWQPKRSPWNEALLNNARREIGDRLFALSVEKVGNYGLITVFENIPELFRKDLIWAVFIYVRNWLSFLGDAV